MYVFVNVIHVHLYSLVYSSARKLGSVSWPNICLALCHVMLPVIVLPVTAYNLISNFFQRQLDGRNSKRSCLRRWIKSVKILTDALMEDLKAATKKNEILYFYSYVLLNLYDRIMYYVALL